MSEDKFSKHFLKHGLKCRNRLAYRELLLPQIVFLPRRTGRPAPLLEPVAGCNEPGDMVAHSLAEPKVSQGSEGGPWKQVAGVVNDVRQWGLGREGRRRMAFFCCHSTSGDLRGYCRFLSDGILGGHVSYRRAVPPASTR